MKKAILVMMVLFAAALTLAAQDYKGKARHAGGVLDDKAAPLEGVKVKHRAFDERRTYIDANESHGTPFRGL